jgi:xyloglucan-specific endo-beta-1,4-glucanase
MALLRLFSSALFASVLCVAAPTASSSTTRVYCGDFDTLTSASSQNIFSTDAWGNDGSGASCVSIPAGDNDFSATWKWTKNQDNVHAFPNVKLASTQLPIQLLNLTSLNFAVDWSMAPSDGSSSLSAIGASADVVIDMFLDPSRITASSTTKPKYEVMVWMGQYGYANAIGANLTKTPPTYKLNGTTFSLYTGPNGNGQTVFSWLAASNITNFNFDITPLFDYLTSHNLLPSTTYLGSVQFGTEAFHATSNVTFSASNFNLKVVKGVKKATASMAMGGVVPNLALIAFLGLGGVMTLL